ncbi:MAG TPA: hypothetical protein VFY23_04105 [Candidatus Limnocylindrales bacterium]|nr:hypothetical protein [Candidatus Limnocylindrales bacterium]
MSPSTRAGSVVIALSVAVAACGTTPATAPDGTQAPTPVAAERTPGPTAAPDLAALLPTSAGGIDFVSSSFTGEDLEGVGVSLDTAELEGIAKAAGVTLAEVEVAEARPVDASKGGVVLAIRIPGANPKEIVEATFSASAALQLRTIGGKSAYEVASSGLNIVVYPKDDIMFQVLGAPAALTEAIVAALP